MRKLIALWLLLAFTAVSVPAIAADRVIVYPLQNPSSVQTNTMQRYPRLAIGNFLRDMLGPSNLGGSYANMTISPVASTLYVTVAPTNAGTDGTLYQLGADDTNPLPLNVSPQLAADATTIMIQGLLSAQTANIGPLSPPGTSGQSVYYLIEAQIQQVDTNAQSQLFVNSAGAKYYQTVNTDRTDAIVFQSKAGTAGVSPSPPSLDSGWISIGLVLVPYGATAITSGMISMTQPFAGFLQASSVPNCSASNPCVPQATASPQPAGGAYYNSSGQLFSSPTPSPAPTPAAAASLYGWTGSAWTPAPSPSPAATNGVALPSGAGSLSPTYGLAAIAPYSVTANNTAATATPAPISAAALAGLLGGANGCPPQITTYTGTSSDTSGTYTTPTCNGVTATTLWIRAVGGGGGGGGSGTSSGTTNSGSGDNSTFGSSLLTASGGGAGGGASSGTAAAGSGGSASGGNIANISGSAGTIGTIGTSSVGFGGLGGQNPLGASGQQVTNGTSGNNAVGCGGGGAGGGAASTTTYAGSGGGAGGYVEHILTAPAASYSYTAGKYGAGGSNASGSPTGGGHGGGGCIIIVAGWTSL